MKCDGSTSGADKASRARPVSAHRVPTLEEVSDALRNWFELSGNPAFQRAERALWQQQPGRPEIDDGWAIYQAQELITEGCAKSLNEALGILARASVPTAERKAFIERLRRKMKKGSTK